ncbi:hypothetical protein FSP39_017346 [Pinctada imbricata]|uniref:Uncharacterized protein n=1 Tax=Pinctada imbricata TaxID=66713 RepID=A0AA88YM04_PINIB|nr:hypothetical protein FSP39_017346 [Pinctada imbricata]
MRKSREFMILAGLWCGPTKPSMNFFLDPLCKAFDELEKGVPLFPEENEDEQIQAFLLGVSCDTPARSAVLNMNQHNGECCCSKCVQSGKNRRTATGGNVRIFPYDERNPTGPKRSHEMMLRNAREALDSKSTHVNGIKGPSVIMFCPRVDCVKSVCIDYMHLVCLGVVRLFLKLCFDVTHSLNDFSLYRYVDIVDQRLESIKLPHFINRQPRSISEHLKFWKAAELRSWLL